MNGLKITLWNEDVMTIPKVKKKYRLKTVVSHMKMLLKTVDNENKDDGKIKEFKEIKNVNDTI